jgi:hypothetical protein
MGYQKSRPLGQPCPARCCSGLYAAFVSFPDIVCCMPVESEYQAAEDAEKYRRRYQKAGDFIEEPEESPETDDGDCRPYR